MGHGEPEARVAAEVLERLRGLGGDVGYDHEGVIQAFIPDRVDSPALRADLRTHWPALKAEVDRECRERAEELRRQVESAAATARRKAPARPSEYVTTVSPEAICKVDAIREAALACGWTLAGLYGNRGSHPFPAGSGYGLACYLEGDHEVGSVCARWIELIGPAPQRHVLRFYNPDAAQPWIARVPPEMRKTPQRREPTPRVRQGSRRKRSAARASK